MIRESIIKLSKKQNLTYLEAEEVMDEIMSGKATPVQMSAYLTALALKGETIDEITASAAGMRAHCIKLLHDMDVLEIVGTVFNILGPLSNPAGANMELMGVYDEALVEPLAQVMANLGVTRGMVVFGQDSLDEISMSAPTSVCEIKDGKFTSYVLTPEQFGYERCTKEELQGGTPQENAEITKAILEGRETGAKRHAVCLNAGAALYIAGKAASIEAGVKMAEQLIDSGAALKKLEEFIEKSNQE